VTLSTSNSQVDCLDFDSLDVCTEEGVEGFPTIYLYKDGMIEDIFSEERTIEKLENFVWQTVNPERVVDEFDPFSLLGDMSFDSNNEEEEDEENDGDDVEEDESDENEEVEKNEGGAKDVEVEKDTEETKFTKEKSETTNDNEEPAETARDEEASDSTKDEL